MNVPVLFSGPYSYSSAPVEMVFAALKLGDLNPERLPTGKKSLSHIADMVAKKLTKVPRSIAIKYWHHAVSSLNGYLYMERIWMKKEAFAIS